ncbi:MAG TPA: superoxide dismutase [Desulfosporosinus sp.]
MVYKLIELPYAYDALEPFCDTVTEKHPYDVHKAYVKALDKIEGYIARTISRGNNSLIKHLELELASRESRHLHSIFWQNIYPGGRRYVQGILAEQVDNDFGSFENLKKQFTTTAVAVEGSGWTLLVWSPYFQELEILQAVENQNPNQWGVIPLLIVNVLEQGYNQKYQNNRGSWVEAWWNLVNWEDVLRRFEECAKIYSD